MASQAYDPSSSWHPQHPEMQDLVPSPAMSVGDRSFDSSQSRQRRGSSPGKRALQWFTRSRSTSPNNVAEPSSPSSFVVRNVVRQPGGVSHDQGNAATEYYQRLKSQPLATTLGVPPGGPGGGVGYGTAKSSNDGRPEEQLARGRSRSPARPASPGAITAGAFRSGRVSPGPQSWAQAKEADEQRKREYSRDRSIPRKPVDSSSPGASKGSPLSGYASSEGQRRGTSPLAGQNPNSESSANERNSFSMPVKFSPNAGPPPIIPLEGVPLPIDIPSSPAQGGTTPLGSVSPAGSPCRYMNGYQARDGPGSPNMASKWMKGLFGKMQRTEEPVEEDYDQGNGSPVQWMMAREGTSPGGHVSASKYLHNSWSDGTPLPNSRSKDEIEAEARKRQSMHMAMRIEDQHRDQVIKAGPSPAHGNRVWNPRQSVGPDEDDEAPRSRSPPGRKPVPRFSVEELQSMTEREREEVATLVDPSGQLSKMQGHLTPAQQIIAETRSQQLEKERAEKQTKMQKDSPLQDPSSPLRGSPQRSGRDEAETPMRRTSKKQQSPTKANNMTPQTNRSIIRPSPQASPNSAAISAGNGPMPLEMPLADALQEMMIRFYRFEKYAVPLMRSMEARIVDVERDNQMALQGDAMSANSIRDREMDKWVGQMTYLMKHEIGQLKAATREIRGGRELIERFAKEQRDPQSNAKRKAKDEVVDHNRNSNFSSSTFKSAVPRKLTLEVPGGEKDATETQSSPSGRPRYTSALGQPMNGGRLSPAASPAKETTSMSRSSSQQRASNLNNRLKALVVEKMRSSSGTSASTHASEKSMSAQEEGGEEESSDNTSFEKVSADERISDDYQVVMARGESGASARSTSGDDIKGRKAASTMSANKAKESKYQDTVKANGVAFPSSKVRPRSVSPVDFSGNTASITLPSHATNGLRARAQSYLLNAESSSGNSSVPTSPIPSPNWRNDASPTLQQVQPLQLHKSINGVYTVKGRSNSEILGSNMPTLKNSDTGSTPIRMSIRDRVAFFDAPK